MTRTNLRVIETPASAEQVLAEAFEALSEAERDVRRLKEIIAAEGRVLWGERNPGQTLFGHLRIEQIRQMVER